MSVSPPPLDATAGPGPEYIPPGWTTTPAPPGTPITPAPVTAAPVATRPLNSKRIGLVGGIVAGVVALALVAWFVVVPLFPGGPGTATTRVPDITTQPTWSEPIRLTGQSRDWLGVLMDTMVGDIAVMSYSSRNALAGIDLATGKVLWQARGYVLAYDIDRSQGFPVGDPDDTHNLARIDPRTGQTLATMMLADPELRAGLTRDSVLVYDSNRGVLCDRVWGHPGCRWETPVSGECYREIRVWGSVPWVSTCEGVIDGRTGKPAFGSDSGTSGNTDVTYTDLKGHTVRVARTVGASTYTLQLWDTRKDEGIGSPVVTGGYPGSWGGCHSSAPTAGGWGETRRCSWRPASTKHSSPRTPGPTSPRNGACRSTEPCMVSRLSAVRPPLPTAAVSSRSPPRPGNSSTT